MLGIVAAGAGARGAYQTPQEFLAEVFPGGSPAAAPLWLSEPLRTQVRNVLGHDLPALRLRYWRREGRTAWILDEIGKDQPITTGVVVADGTIETIRVLVFREIRGWEVRYPFFTDQFRGARLNADLRLDRPIDGITGATMSVRALTNVARLALVLDHAAAKPDLTLNE
jgi:hypothetical protein